MSDSPQNKNYHSATTLEMFFGSIQIRPFPSFYVALYLFRLFVFSLRTPPQDGEIEGQSYLDNSKSQKQGEEKKKKQGPQTRGR